MERADKADAQGGEAAPSQAEGDAAAEDREFEPFVPYYLDRKKLLDWQFEFSKRPRGKSAASDEDGEPVVMTGADLRALIDAEPRDHRGFSVLGRTITLGEQEYRLLKEPDRAPFSLLTTLLEGTCATDSRHRSVCEATLRDRGTFYILSRGCDPTANGYHHVYIMFALLPADEGETLTTVLTLSFFGEKAELVERFFKQADDASDDATLAFAGVVTDFQHFFRGDRRGPYWAAVFSQRARYDADASRILALCLPELPGVALNHLAHLLRRDQSELQAAMADRISDRFRESLQPLIRRVAWLTFVVVLGIVLMLTDVRGCLGY